MSSNRRKNIFVLGHDDRHSADLQRIPDADRFRIHPLLDSSEVIYQKHYDIQAKLDKARRILRDFDGPVDGIVCHWDFPATSMAAILCREFDLLFPSLEAILKSSHKYWSRLEQQKAAPECTPDFCALDPFDDNAEDNITLDFPFWLKPVKAYGSALGFRIDNREDLKSALATVRNKIHRLGDAVDDILARAEVPPEVASVGGTWLICEQLVGGWELAPEGCIRHGKFSAHGTIDMVRAENQKSFTRYQYPSAAPDTVKRRAFEVAEKVLSQIGFDNGCFNVEFFWDEEEDQLWIIEINPRISQSHSYQFEMVDGMSNHEVAVHVALGDDPQFRHGEGPYEHAAKCLLRRYDTEDAIVKRIPSEEDLERLKKTQPDTDVNVLVEEGQRLSELLDQDAYSYLLAEVFIAAHSAADLDNKYRQAQDMLPFEFSPVTSEGN